MAVLAIPFATMMRILDQHFTTALISALPFREKGKSLNFFYSSVVLLQLGQSLWSINVGSTCVSHGESTKRFLSKFSSQQQQVLCVLCEEKALLS